MSTGGLYVVRPDLRTFRDRVVIIMILTKCSPHIHMTQSSVGSSSPVVFTLAKTPETNLSLMLRCQSNMGLG